MSEQYEAIDISEELAHYGTPRHSGRYPWGSGDNPYQHEAGFLAAVDDLKRQGLSEAKIAEAMGMSTTDLRAMKSIAKANVKAENIRRATQLKDHGYSTNKIAEMMGMPESTVRTLLDPVLQERNDRNTNTANILKQNVDEKGFIDIGAGVEREMGVSDTSLKTAVQMLKADGYSVAYIQVEQATNPGKFTTIKVLCPPGTTKEDIHALYEDKTLIKSVGDYSIDNGKTFFGIEYPKSIDSSRIQIKYAEEGGTDMDGVIQLRRGVEDISLGSSSYAQVRIAVDGSHYLKGMAIYSDDMPDGVDIIYNTNKHVGTDKYTVFKKLKDDPDNPFGAVIKAGGQRHYIDDDGNDQLSVINKIKDEGDWADYSKTLSAQFLSKQSMQLINRQLDLSYAEKRDEYDEIMKLTNPAVRKKLLQDFSDGLDAASVDLKASALPGQATKVILPVPSLKETEIYAPSYPDGSYVALVRYPHGGTFEIPVLKVNNKQADAKSLLKNAKDAVGITSAVAERLSGADFDGDTVMVLPTKTKQGVNIVSTPQLEGLKGFDSKSYKYTQEQLDAGAKVISSSRKQMEMGKVSNLITDMTLKGATNEELTRAVKHSMVVIDAEKHALDYKQSEIDNGIPQLKAKYQGKATAGSSTLISKAKSPKIIDEREEGAYVTDATTGKSTKRYIDISTGEKLYTETGRTYTDKKTGKEKVATQRTTKMAAAKDAHTLSSGTQQEEAYANYANKLKSLANEARKSLIFTESVKMNPDAKKTYKVEVDSLDAKLNVALKNAPKERQAQLIADKVVSEKKQANPDMDKADIKKAKQQAIAQARVSVGASGKDSRISITEKEWAAIQNGAVSQSKLEQILDHADMDEVKKLATPRATSSISSTKEAKIKAMAASGYTTAEIAEACGVSTSTVSKVI